MNHDDIKQLLHTMFTGWILHEASYEQRTDSRIEATRSPEDAMIEACGGDEQLANLLCLFSHWSNDVTSVAAHYGLTLARRQPDGTLLHPDGTVDTLIKGGVLEIVKIEPAPAPNYYWHEGRWNAPKEQITSVVVSNTARS